MDPGVLFGSQEAIEARIIDTAQKARNAGVRHIMNLGHGILQVRQRPWGPAAGWGCGVLGGSGVECRAHRLAGEW